MRTAAVRGLGDGLTALFTGLAGLTILVMGISLVSHNSLDGVFLALLPLTAIASFEAVQPLSLAAQNLDSSLTAANRLFELIDTDPPVVDPQFSSPKPADYRLQIHNLHFRYTEDEPPAIDGLSLELFSGQCLALIGPSGAGKTSLVNLLLRFWDYQEGEILLGGHDLRSYCADDLREMIGVVSQQPYLFNGSIQDNLWLANPDASEADLAEACRKVQLDEFIYTLPEGYKTMIGENGMLLSGGERQRLAIARALLKDAPILILDEATTNLDAITAEKVMQALREIMVGRTTLIISHQRSGLDFADHVLVM
jgi:ABC-type multidrug transport system fused ATPase/permease subunit